ncbi:MAG: DNA repair protein RecN, partial [Clostridiaceae bacterium]|nr:DNA repair protein RecN [Clostridiaceae bacterium]
LSEIELSDEILKNLENELTSAQNELKRRAKELRDTRIEAAKILEEKICGELSSLDMPKVTFKVSFKDCPFSEKGSEEVEFLISTSLIEPVKPLNKIASGGEMSRIMLAIKSVLSDVDMVETLVFDEIDAGVSGRAAQRIAEKLKALSKKRQIICVTHLPQIAAQSDYHFLIEKTISDNDAITTVKVLSDEERIRELARIIGGKEITENTLKSAKEMLEMARTG